MKKHLSAILALTLILLFSNTAFGAPDIDTWYSIEDEEPHFSGSYQSMPDRSMTGLMVEYYRNDFLFLNGVSMDDPEDSRWLIMGSYIFEDLGFFIGLGYQSAGRYSSYLVSPGYRWGIDEGGYLALSLDYSDEAIEGLELRAKYSRDALKLLGRLYVPNGRDPFLSLDLAYQLSEKLVIGGDLAYNGGASLSVGATWKPGSTVVDATVDSDGEYAVSGVYYFGAFGIGAQYDGETYSLKSRYDTADSYFALVFMPEQSPLPLRYLASLTMKF